METSGRTSLFHVFDNVKLSPAGLSWSCPGFLPLTKQDHRSDIVLLVCTSQNSLPGQQVLALRNRNEKNSRWGSLTRSFCSPSCQGNVYNPVFPTGYSTILHLVSFNVSIVGGIKVKAEQGWQYCQGKLSLPQTQTTENSSFTFKSTEPTDIVCTGFTFANTSPRHSCSHARSMTITHTFRTRARLGSGHTDCRAAFALVCALAWKS